MKMTIAWWGYVLIAISAFFCGVLLNYIVKKINEARLDERITRIHHKTSQSTQVQVPLIEMETKTGKPLENIIASSNKGISLVFKREENDDDTRKKEERKELPMRVTVSNTGALNTREPSVPKAATTSKSNIPRRIASVELKSKSVLSSSLSKRETSEIPRPKIEEVEKPTFLGNIYKNDLSRTRAKSKSSIVNTEGSFKEVVEKIIGRMNESKSTPSIHKLYDLQTDKDMRRWISDIVLKSKCTKDKEGTSSNK